jgi:hypothetical protein
MTTGKYIVNELAVHRRSVELGKTRLARGLGFLARVSGNDPTPSAVDGFE